MPATRRHRDEVSRWVLTSLMLSLLVHLLLVHYLGAMRLFDVESFASSVSRWFHVVEMPPAPPPEIAAYARNLPPQAERPAPPPPVEVPLLKPEQRIPHAELGPEGGPAPAPRSPAAVRLPEAPVPVVHARGGADIDQTLAQMGEVAPQRTRLAPAVAPRGAGVRKVLRGTSGRLVARRARIALAELGAPRPATESVAGPLAPPKVEPTPVEVPLSGPPAQGIAIPLEPALAVQEAETPPVLIFPAIVEEGEGGRPVVPLGDEVGVKMETYGHPGDPMLYFKLEIAVAKPEKLPVIPKDVVFICDVSLSMRRREIDVARQAVGAYLGRLRATDRFNVVVFSEQAKKLFPDFVEPTPERVAAAARFIRRIPGQVKTDVYRVLQSVVRDVAAHSVRNRPTTIFFVSDGRSTAGIRDARRIVNYISAYARPNFAILPFDSGRPGNLYLLDLLAYRTRGELTHTDDIEEGGQALRRLFNSHENPVLMNLRLTYTNLDVAETYPTFLPNLYAGKPIVIYGRCKPGQNVTVQLEGKNPYAKRALRFSGKLANPDPTQGEIARQWARRKIHHLVADMARVGEKPELKDQIKRLGRQYGVPTPYSD